MLRRGWHLEYNCDLEQSVLRVMKELPEMAFGPITPIKVVMLVYYAEKCLTLTIRPKNRSLYKIVTEATPELQATSYCTH